MPNLSWTGSNGQYRYGMNGQESDNEIANGIYTAEFWEYDSRTARRWNVDPVTNASISSYGCFENNPIFKVDLEGDNPGDYYNKEGEHMGSDGKDDDKVYVADNVKKNNDGTNTFTNAKELTITHTQFQKLSGLASKEDGKKSAIFGVANAQANRIKNAMAKGKSFDKAYNTFNQLNADKNSEGLHGYMLENRPVYKDYWNSTVGERSTNVRFKTGQAAVVNAWSPDGTDFTNGATGWDGIDANIEGWPAYKERRSAGFTWSTNATVVEGAKMTPQNMPEVLNENKSAYYIITYSTAGSIFWKPNPNWKPAKK